MGKTALGSRVKKRRGTLPIIFQNFVCVIVCKCQVMDGYESAMRIGTKIAKENS